MDDTSIRISSNRLVDLADFKPEDVDLESISRSLNNIKRFTGHYAFSRPLSVAQHSYLTKMIAEKLYSNNEKVYLACILHDFGEAYYGDLSSPLKRHLGDYFKDKIKKIDEVIYQKLWKIDGSFLDVEKECKTCDHISLRIEQQNLFGTFPPEEYVREFMQKYDTRKMFMECSKYEIDLVTLYQTYCNNTKEEADKAYQEAVSKI